LTFAWAIPPIANKAAAVIPANAFRFNFADFIMFLLLKVVVSVRTDGTTRRSGICFQNAITDLQQRA
jgi:hypothetical protein